MALCLSRVALVRKQYASTSHSCQMRPPFCFNLGSVSGMAPNKTRNMQTSLDHSKHPFGSGVAYTPPERRKVKYVFWISIVQKRTYLLVANRASQQCEQNVYDVERVRRK